MVSFFLVLFFLFFHPAGAIIFMSEKISAIPFFWWQDVYGKNFCLTLGVPFGHPSFLKQQFLW